ncbi:MAG: DUF4389 domain-containing protein [Pontibacterium sp.]
MRLLYMLLFCLFYNVAEVVIGALVLFLFLTVLFSGEANKRLLAFGQSLSIYVFQVMRFLTFNTESRPFPFGEWPDNVTVTAPEPEKVPEASEKPEQSAEPEEPEKTEESVEPEESQETQAPEKPEKPESPGKEG